MVASLLLGGGWAGYAAEEPSVPARPPLSLEVLRKELVAVRSELKAAEQGIEQRNKALREKQHELEYEDPEIVALREELRALERQVLEKRQQLQTRIASKPALKKMEGERRELFQTLQRLRDTEAAIQREIAALERSEP